MNEKFDVAVVGSGFGGALLAMIARRLGRSVVMLEKGTHPRFAIGESSTPLANLLLEEIATRYDLPRILPLTKWGSWQRSYPDVACGLKRGFTFYAHTLGRSFTDAPGRGNQLLVAASPHDEIADTHWYRPDFDHFLVREAQALGVDYRDRVSLHGMTVSSNGCSLAGERGEKPLQLRAQFVVDATGPRGFVHRSLGLPELPFDSLPPTQGLFTHFRGVRRLSDTTVGAADEAPPFPVDDAAVHHVFDGGWIWVLRFNNGVTSAGVAATDALADRLRLAEGARAWERLLAELPTVAEQFADAVPQLAFVHAPRLAFQSGRIVGECWALLPSAAGFIDPLLSTGFPLTLLGIARLADAIERDWGCPGFEERLNAHASTTRAELLAAERLIAALYANMNDFPRFAHLALLYFAAASFTETARRLGRPELAGSFLMHDHPVFGPRLRAICERAMLRPAAGAGADLVAHIEQAIAPIDVAGFSDRGRRNWYPVNAADLLGAADKLSASQEEMAQLLVRCGVVEAAPLGAAPER